MPYFCVPLGDSGVVAPSHPCRPCVVVIHQWLVAQTATRFPEASVRMDSLSGRGATPKLYELALLQALDTTRESRGNCPLIFRKELNTWLFVSILSDNVDRTISTYISTKMPRHSSAI